MAITSADLGLAQFIASIVNISDASNSPSIYWQYGLFIVIAVVHGLINSISVKYNGFFNQTSLYWHLVGTLLIVIVALVLTPNKASAKWVVSIYISCIKYQMFNLYSILFYSLHIFKMRLVSLKVDMPS